MIHFHSFRTRVRTIKISHSTRKRRRWKIYYRSERKNEKNEQSNHFSWTDNSCSEKWRKQVVCWLQNFPLFQLTLWLMRDSHINMIFTMYKVSGKCFKDISTKRGWRLWWKKGEYMRRKHLEDIKVSSARLSISSPSRLTLTKRKRRDCTVCSVHWTFYYSFLILHHSTHIKHHTQFDHENG